MQNLDQVIEKAESLLEQSPKNAILLLVKGVTFPAAERDDDSRWARIFNLLSTASIKLKALDLGEALKQVATHPANPEILFTGANLLLQREFYELAAILFKRADEHTTHDEAIVSRLVMALEAMGRNSEACDVLYGHAELVAGRFLPNYLLVYNSILAGNLESARENIEDLRSENEEQQFMVSTVQRMLNRAALFMDSVPFNMSCWNFVINKSTILLENPLLPEAMQGRFGHLHDTYAACRAGLLAFAAHLKKRNIIPGKIASFEDHGSKSLAIAAKEMFGAELLPPDQARQANIIICYDLSRLADEKIMAILLQNPGIILYSHAMHWAQDFALAPDYNGVLYQVIEPPWVGRPVLGESGDVIREDTVELSAEQVAEKIIQAGETDAVLSPSVGLVEECRGKDISLNQQGSRERFHQGSPVKSARLQGSLL